jgi:hypothetical protein
MKQPMPLRQKAGVRARAAVKARKAKEREKEKEKAKAKVKAKVKERKAKAKAKAKRERARAKVSRKEKVRAREKVARAKEKVNPKAAHFQPLRTILATVSPRLERNSPQKDSVRRTSFATDSCKGSALTYTETASGAIPKSLPPTKPSLANCSWQDSAEKTLDGANTRMTLKHALQHPGLLRLQRPTQLRLGEDNIFTHTQQGPYQHCW